MDRFTVLNSPFDIDIHKATFINYLEVVILEDGTIEYAVPSHQEKLIKIACKRLNVTRAELNRMCPRNYWADFITWLCDQSHAIAVWNTFYQGSPNELQMESLYKLQEADLLKLPNENKL